MDNEAIPQLIEQLSDSNGLRRQEAREALVEIGAPALPYITQAAANNRKRPRWEAAKALATMAEPSSVPTLTELLDDPESDIRWLAAEGLLAIGSRSLPAVLDALVQKPESTGLRRAAHHVLDGTVRRDAELSEVLVPIMEALGDTQPASVIPPKAEEALERLDSLSG